MKRQHGNHTHPELSKQLFERDSSQYEVTLDLKTEMHHLGSARVLQELWRERARMGQTSVRDLAREDRLHHLAQPCSVVALAPLRRLVGKLVVHRAADGRADAVTADDEVARRRRAILEVERDGVRRRGFGVGRQAFGEVDPIAGVEMLGEELLEDGPVECVYCRGSGFVKCIPHWRMRAGVVKDVALVVASGSPFNGGEATILLDCARIEQNRQCYSEGAPSILRLILGSLGVGEVTQNPSSKRPPNRQL